MPQAKFYQVNALPAGIGIVPKNALALRAAFDFATDGPIQSADLGTYQMRASEWFQSLYVDNSENAGELHILFDGSNQTVHIPGLTTGWYPVLALNPPKITITSPYARGRCTVFLCNFPRQLSIAPAYGAGNLNVMQNPSVSGGVDTAVPQYSTGSRLFGDTVAAGSTNLVFAGSTNNQSFYLTYINIHLTGNASIAVAGDFVVELRSSGTAFMRFAAYLPAAPVAAPLGNIVLASFSDVKVRNTVIGGTLQINVVTALATGRLYYNIGCGVTQLG